MAPLYTRGLLILCLLFSTCFAQKINLSPEQESVLRRFFQVLIEESEVGYVLLGKKPVCIHGFFHKDPFFVDTKLHKQTVALREGARIWNQIASTNSNVSIHISDKEDPQIPNIIHVLAIHRPLLLEVLTRNITLFQYILGPSMTPEKLFRALTSETSTYHSLLKEDKVLVGEILGFGTQNALYVSRIENIEEELEKVIPPFLKLQAVAREYRQEYLPFKTSLGFTSATEELNTLQKKVSFPSEKLVQRNPEFVFGCLKDSEETKNLIKELETAQTEIQARLHSQDFLEKTLHEFTGKACISPPNSYFSGFQFNKKALNRAVAKGIWESVQTYDHEFLPYFISGMKNPNVVNNKTDRAAYFPNYRRELLTARNNLEYAENLFSSLNGQENIHSIIPKRLFYRTLRKGKDIESCQGTLVSLEFSIFSPLGHCLTHETDRLVNLKNTIPGFALGIQGMKVGETREVFIHPAYAYGFDTSLDKCLALRAVVTLLKIHDNRPYTHPGNRIDLSFVLDDETLNKRTERYKTALTEKGSRIGHHLKKYHQIDLNLVCKYLNKFQHNEDKFEPTTDDEQALINQMHWNIYFGH